MNYLRLVWLAFIVVLLTACPGGSTPTPEEEVKISIDPTSATIGVGGTQTFTATVDNTDNTSVEWSADKGTISGSGNSVTYTAPDEEGEDTVTVTSEEDTSKSATATVTVTTTPAPDTPEPPSNAQAEAGPGTVTVSWTDNSDNETGFIIYRQTGADADGPFGDFSELAEVGANVTSYSDSDVEEGTYYKYQVAAKGEAGNSSRTAPTDPAVTPEDEPVSLILNVDVISDTVAPDSNDLAQYEVVISNPTSETASSLVLEQTALSSLFSTFSSSSNLDGGTRITQGVQWDLGNLDAGDSITLRPIIATQRLEAGTSIPSIFELTYAGATEPIVDNDNEILVVEDPALELLAHIDRSLISTGDTVTYTLSYTNQSDSASATDSTLTANVPEDTTFVSATDGGTNTDGTITWDLDVLSTGEYGQVQFTVTVGSLPLGGIITMDAELTNSDEAAPTARASATNIVEDEDPLSVTVNVLSDTVAPDSNDLAQYEVVISNPTSETVSSLVLEQTALSSLFSTFSSSSNLDGGTRITQGVQWDLGNLDAGDSITLRPIIATQRLEDATLIPSTFELSYAGTTSTILVDTEVTVDAPVLELIASGNRSLVSSGDSVTYTLDYSNLSTDTNATDSTLTASIPSGTTFASATGGGANADGTVTWDLDVISPKETGEVQFTVTVGSLPLGDIFTTDVALTNSDEAAPTARASATNIVEDEDPLSVTVNVLSDTVAPDSNDLAQYEVVISNPTSETVSSLVLEQTALSSLFSTFSSSSNLDGGTRITQGVQWDLGNLDAGDSITLRPIIATQRLEDATLIPSTFELSYAGTTSTIQVDTVIVVEASP